MKKSILIPDNPLAINLLRVGVSCNKKILENEEERQAIINHRAGLVFVTTGQDDAVKLLLLPLKELDWLR